jgi:multiple sugar transport system permease protein
MAVPVPGGRNTIDEVAARAISSASRRCPSPRVVLLLPAQLTLLVVVVAPSLILVFLSLTDWQLTQGVPWFRADIVWFWNFYDLYFDERFLHAVVLTVAFVAVCVAVELALAVGLALLFLEDWWWRKAALALIVLPMMIVPVDAANAFFMLFNERGPINYLIELSVGHTFDFAWLGDPETAVLPIALAEIWQWTPLMFLLVLSGFLNSPRNQHRAAIALGASSTRAFLSVLLPLALPVIGIATLIRAIETFKVFDSVYILTRGGPGAVTETISMFMFNGAFVYFRMGYIAAAALLVLFLVAGLCMGLLKPLQRNSR